MKTIVFQGDSITNAARLADNDQYMGSGYVTMTAGRIAVDYPGQYRFYNRGLSGIRVVDMYARIKCGALNLNPDILTILIGVNGVNSEFTNRDGIDSEKYAMLLEMYCKEVLQKSPATKIVLMEPFVLSGSATDCRIEDFRRELALRSASCKAIAEKYGLIFIPLQKDMDEMAERTSPENVLYDGIHPTCCGHELISRKLYEAMKTIL